MELPEDHTFRELRFWVNSWTSLSHLFNHSIPPGQEKVKWEMNSGASASASASASADQCFPAAVRNRMDNGRRL